MSRINLEEVYFRYSGSDKWALRNITLKADAGEIILLAGPSGCGKTTLARVLNGLIPHFHQGEFMGKAVVAGMDVTVTEPHIMASKVGMVFQDPENQLFLSTVEREIAFGLENMGLSREEIEERVEWALELLGIEELREKAPYELSGGQQQKVAIASVLAMRPEVLVMDEPMANLDPLSARSIVEEVHRLATSLRLTVILIEHRLEIVLDKVTRIVLMKEGRIVDDGPVREVLRRRRIGVIGLPGVVEAYWKLRGMGIELPHPPVNEHDMASMVRALVASDAGD